MSDNGSLGFDNGYTQIIPVNALTDLHSCAVERNSLLAVSQWLRKFLAALPWLIAPMVIGGIFGQGFGMLCGLVVGVIYVVFAAFGTVAIPSDVFKARLMELGEILDLPDMVDKYAERSGIGPPSLYIVELDEPNILVWASGDGRRGFTRIGVPRGICNVLTAEEIEACMALAIARVASGEAAVLAFGAALAGMALMPVFSRPVNTTFGFFRPDPDTRLTPIGGALLALLTPLSRLSLMAVMPEGALEWSDAYAARMTKDPALLATVMFKIASAGPEPGTGACRKYNPGLLPMFLASPFDKLHGVAKDSPWPARLVSFIADAGSTTTLRGQCLQDMASQASADMPVKVKPDDGWS